jgi:Tfp pilus assembly protein PilN
MAVSRLASILLLLVAIAASIVFWLQRQTGAVLREEISLLRADAAELARLRIENQNLKSMQPSETELSGLRADHAAAMRLRTELNSLRERITAAEAALQKPEAGR